MDRIAQLLAFIQDTPDDPFLHYALTMEYVKSGDTEQSLSGFRNMLAKYPGYVGTYYHYAKFLEKQDKKNEAIEIYQQGIEVARKSRNMHALGELQGALNMLVGFDDDEEEY